MSSKKQIINSIIAGVSILVITFFFGEIKNILTLKTTISVWALSMLILFSLSFLVIAIFKLKSPKYRKYRKDTFNEFGNVEWEWSYPLFGSNILNISRYCPNDNTFLVSQELMFPTISTIFKCESCDSTYGRFEGNISQIEWRIKRQIDKKIRNKGYLTH